MLTLPEPYYRDEVVTIFHARCEDILPCLDLSEAVVVTDSPYGVGFDYGDPSFKDTEEEFIASILPTLEVAASGEAALCMSMRQMHRLPPSRWALCWYKPGSVRRNRVAGWSIWEPIFLYGGTASWTFANDAVTLPDCVNHDKGNTHPCPKPLRLMKWIISGYAGKARLIVDPFCGSGTTLRAAKDLGYRAIGIDSLEWCCLRAAERCRQEVLSFANGGEDETEADVCR